MQKRIVFLFIISRIHSLHTKVEADNEIIKVKSQAKAIAYGYL
jgi:hypothetical protein